MKGYKALPYFWSKVIGFKDYYEKVLDLTMIFGPRGIGELEMQGKILLILEVVCQL